MGTPKQQPKKEPTPEERKAESEARAKRCVDRIFAVLKDERCSILAVADIENGLITTKWGVHTLE